MKNPLSRARSRRSDEPTGDDAAADAADAADTPAGEAWTAYEPDHATVEPTPHDGAADGAADARNDDVPVIPADADADDVAPPAEVDASEAGTGGPSRTERLGRLLAVSNRAYLVVAAIALLVGPSAGASARAHLAAAIPRPKPAAVAAPADDELAADEGDDGEEIPTVDDGRRRYLVSLEPTTGATTTAPGRTTTATVPTATTTTTAPTVTAPTAPPATVKLPPPPFPVTILPGEETQWVDVVRVDASRIAVLLPVRYLQLVRETDTARATYPVEAGRTLVRDRDGRYWATAVDGMDPTLFELAGQLPPPAPSGHSTDASADHTTTGSTGDDAHADDAAGHDATAGQETTGHDTTAHDTTTHETTTHETTGHESTTHGTTGHETTTHGTTGHDTAGHDTTGHETPTTVARRGTTLPTIARSTTTTLSPAPPALVEPVPLADRDLAIALASLPGVEEVKALGPGVFAVIGILDPADIEAVPGVASVREDTQWSSTRLRR